MSVSERTPRWFSIGLYAGPSPLELAPVPEVPDPVLTTEDVTDFAARFVADPFVLRHDGLWHLFFEAWNEGTAKGEIALAVSEDLRSWDYQGRVLTEPWSVSYPHVVCCRGEIYMVPELCGQDAVHLYRAVEFPRRWQPDATLIEGVPAADPTPFHHGDSWWMLVCTAPDTHDELRLYRADDLAGPWEEHPASPIVQGDSGAARPAGRVVDGAGGPIRFAQDCRRRYGESVEAFEITRLTRDEYEERPLGRPFETPAEGAWNCLALHHVDAHRLADGAWIALVDGHDHPPT